MTSEWPVNESKCFKDNGCKFIRLLLAIRECFTIHALHDARGLSVSHTQLNFISVRQMALIVKELRHEHIACVIRLISNMNQKVKHNTRAILLAQLCYAIVEVNVQKKSHTFHQGIQQKRNVEQFCWFMIVLHSNSLSTRVLRQDYHFYIRRMKWISRNLKKSVTKVVNRTKRWSSKRIFTHGNI